MTYREKLIAIEAIYAKVPAIACRGLCQAGCGPIAMSSFEWRRIQKRTMGLHARPTRQQQEEMICPLLNQATGRCRVYQERPLICRLYGTTEMMRCPHGCEPARVLSREEGFTLLDELDAVVGGGHVELLTSILSDNPDAATIEQRLQTLRAVAND